MAPSSGIGWAYDPEILTTMGNAFDHACDCLPVQFRGSDNLRRKLALHIIREINDGESDPTRLVHSAVSSLLVWSLGSDAEWRVGFRALESYLRDKELAGAWFPTAH